MMKILSTILCAFAFAIIGCGAPPITGETQQEALVKSKIIQFPAATFADLATAHAAGETHRAALVAAGNDWAIAGWPGAGPIDALDGENAGVYIGKLTPALADPAGTERVNFLAHEYIPDPE